MADFTQLIANLPQVFSTLQIIVYLGLILFFGSISVFGWRGWGQSGVRLLVRLGAGLLALVSALALRPLMTLPQMFQMFQLDVLILGIAASIVVGITLFFLTWRSKAAVSAMKKKISSLENKVRFLERLRPGKKMALLRIIGVLLLIGLLGIIALNFRGFPNMGEDIITSLGFPEAGGIGQALSSPVCAQALSVIAENPQLIQQAQLFESPEWEAIFNSEDAGVEQLGVLDTEPQIVLGLTVDGGVCYGSQMEFCGCFG